MAAKPTRRPTPKKRRNWKPVFLKELARTGNVSQAAHKAKIVRVYAYEAREADPVFAVEWDAALEVAIDALELEARRRAVQGVTEPVGWYQGKAGGKVQRYSDTLLIFLLKAHRPEKFRDSVELEHKGGVHLTHDVDAVIDRVYGDAGDAAAGEQNPGPAGG